MENNTLAESSYVVRRPHSILAVVEDYQAFLDLPYGFLLEKKASYSYYVMHIRTTIWGQIIDSSSAITSVTAWALRVYRPVKRGEGMQLHNVGHSTDAIRLYSFLLMLQSAIALKHSRPRTRLAILITIVACPLLIPWVDTPLHTLYCTWIHLSQHTIWDMQRLYWSHVHACTCVDPPVTLVTTHHGTVGFIVMIHPQADRAEITTSKIAGNAQHTIHANAVPNQHCTALYVGD